jgi:dTMP kinase
MKRKGKLIVIEGTDCSGKETQANLLVEKLRNKGIKVEKLSFPMYDTPTGKIVGGPYLGKKHISEGFFPEGASNVDPMVAALYYMADRRYNISKVNELLDKGYYVILDRYVTSNMGHQGGKLKSKEERLKMYKWLEKIEYGFLELPKPDLVIFLYMPYQCVIELRKNREEVADQHESNEEHLINAENAYLELVDIYNFKKVNCAKKNIIRTPEDISEDVYEMVNAK